MYRKQLTLKKRKLYKQFYYRLKFFKVELYLKILRYLLKSMYIEKQVIYIIIYYLAYILKITSLTYFTKICRLTQHYRSVDNTFNLNRLSILTNASGGFFPGTRSASW
jgi:hypothetical protein